MISVSIGARPRTGRGRPRARARAGRGDRRAVGHARGRARQPRSASCRPPLQAAADAAARLIAAALRGASCTTPSPARSRRAIRYRAEGLIALTQALNGPTRAALSTLRAGGNRSGAEAVLTWQTGYPLAVTSRRATRATRRPSRGLGRLGAGGAGASWSSARRRRWPTRWRASRLATPAIVIGPRASEAPFPARVAIDTGVAGIHEAGIGYRMDDVPLPLRPPLAGPRSAADDAGRAARARCARGDRGGRR